MIARLRGVLFERAGDVIVVDCGGVGYEVHVSAHTMASLPPVDSPVELRIYTHTSGQDGRITLFGFAGGNERELFDLLITVKKVGPTAAMGILSGGYTPEDIARLVVGESTAALMKIKGVGRKTAEMIVVELRDRCAMLLAQWGAAQPEAASGSMLVVDGRGDSQRDPMIDDVATALVQMGWRATEADKVVALLEPGPEATLESLLRQALQAMPT